MLSAVEKSSTTELREQKVAGSYRLLSSGIQFICPCGCSEESYLNIDPNHPGSVWKLTNDTGGITLHPSVFNTGLPCRWHGWLRNGYWIGV